MITSNEIFSEQLERQVLASFIQYPESFLSFQSFIKEGDFTFDIHKVIYKLLKNKERDFDIFLLSEEIKEYGSSLVEDMTPSEYVLCLKDVKIFKKGIEKYCQELSKITLRRNLFQGSQKLQGYIKNKSAHDNPLQIISNVDSFFTETLSSFNHEEPFINIFDDIEDIIEESGNNPSEVVGLPSPFESLTNYIGGFRNGNVYAFCARPKQGKSTFLAYLSNHIANVQGIPVLYLDTEMTTEEFRWRLLTSIINEKSDIRLPLSVFESGRWRNNKELARLVKEAIPILKTYKIDHKYVANMQVGELRSYILYWYYSRAGRGNPCAITYDYIKITGENIDDAHKEYQVIGEKLQALKEIVTKDINCPLFTAAQRNRQSSEDDDTSIAMSDRILWFASSVFVFRKKTPDELSEEKKVINSQGLKIDLGTHKLIPVENRHLGDNATIKDKDGKVLVEKFEELIEWPEIRAGEIFTRLRPNWFNMRIEDFHVKEVDGNHLYRDKLKNYLKNRVGSKNVKNTTPT